MVGEKRHGRKEKTPLGRLGLSSRVEHRSAPHLGFSHPGRLRSTLIFEHRSRKIAVDRPRQ
jgi:hypothetical protein